jgi:hypothetical protein
VACTCPHLVLMLVAVLLAACAPAAVTPAPSASVWGAVLEAAQAEQTNAPALAVTNERATLAWVAADADGVHQDARALVDGRLSPTVILPLPPVAPRNSTLAPSTGDALHLLWLDLDPNNTAQLYSALIEDSLGVFRGPQQVSELGGRCYATAPGPDGALRVVWQDGSLLQPTLHSATIEQTGLIIAQQPLIRTDGCPAAAATLDATYALWVDNGQLVVAELVMSGLLGDRVVADMPSITVGDRLRALQAGSDGERLYVFWNITRADGSQETWYTTGMPDDETWPEPRRVRFDVDETTSFDTTLNTGTTFAAGPSDNGLAAAWAAPLRGVTTVLPVATWAEGALGVLYFDDGEVVGYQRVVEVSSLLGPPTLHLDQDRHLYLGWAEPQTVGAAALRLTTTRPLFQSN